MKDFRKLDVWAKAHALTLAIYRVTAGFPTEERYGLTSQLRRAALSIPTNITEGCGRNTDAEFNRFLEIAMGSASETEYLLLLSFDQKYIDDSVLHKRTAEVIEVKRMLASLIGKVKADRRALKAEGSL